MKCTITQNKLCLTDNYVHQLFEDGFTVVRGFASASDLEQSRKLLTNLFERFQELPRNFTYDLSKHSSLNNKLRNLEIVHCSWLERQLVKSQLFRNLKVIARQLLGQEAYFWFDHAVLKPPHSYCPTDWHQDEAYEKPGGSRQRVSFWLPLNNVTEENGCLQYIPGSHKKDLLPHHAIARGAHVLTTNEVNTEQAVSCPVNAGDFIIHWGRTLHYTGPNITAQSRLAWVVVFAVGGSSFRERLLQTAVVLHRVREVRS